MVNLKQYLNRKYNYLTILEILGVEKGKRQSIVRCDCGTVIQKSLPYVLNGQIKACSASCSQSISLADEYVGTRHGRLVITKILPMNNKSRYVDVVCDCGSTKIVNLYSILQNTTKSCGCLYKEGNGRTHGMTGTRIYMVWDSMIRRCHTPNHKAYGVYGGAGIYVCDRWQEFQNFYADMGECPEGMSLDRFPTTAKVYSKDTCRWATKEQQMRNTRGNRSSKSGFKGVRYDKHKPSKPWTARIWLNNKSQFLGSFSNPEEAAKQYDTAALDAWGKDAFLNFPLT